jgi:hypothetical protein
VIGFCRDFRTGDGKIETLPSPVLKQPFEGFAEALNIPLRPAQLDDDAAEAKEAVEAGEVKLPMPNQSALFAGLL